MPPAVRVVVVAYNAGEHLARCVEALRRQSFADFEAVIVDNASTDGAVDRLGALEAPFRILRMDRNVGFAAGCNAGARGCAAPWLAMLNPDAFAEPDWLARLMAATARHPDVAMFAAVQLDAANPAVYDGLGDHYSPYGIGWRGAKGQPVRVSPSADGRVFSPCAAAALYRTAAFAAAGGFDERYFCYFEDLDLGFRLRLAGSDCVLVADAAVRHVGSAITGRASAFSVYHGWRNRIWTFWKDMPAALLWPCLPLFALAHLPLLALAARHGQARAALRGVRDGLGGLGALAAARREVQRSRRIGVVALMSALTWSPVGIVRRRAAMRPAAGAPPSAAVRR
ncbi:MAG: glycosyltransferase family 2 protein [Rhodospirillales bacterium]